MTAAQGLHLAAYALGVAIRRHRGGLPPEVDPGIVEDAQALLDDFPVDESTRQAADKILKRTVLPNA